MPPFLRYLPLALLLAACAPDIEVPSPVELAVKQVGYGHAATLELSWRVVIRAGGYIVEYGTASGKRDGTGLKLVQWPDGCGDFDLGVSTPEAGVGALDAGPPSVPTPSPVRVPAAWCLERAHTYSDAGVQPVATPASRPRLRLAVVNPGTAYYFAVRAFRLASTSDPSTEVSITPVKDKTP